MKKLLLYMLCMGLSFQTFAQGRGGGGQGGQRGGGFNLPATGGQGRQQQQPAQATPLPVRQVSGIVKDTTDQSVIGATVTLISKNDTLKASTNADGVFVFKTVKTPEFSLSVNSMGMAPFVKKYLYTYTVARLVLDPIILKNDSKMLGVVQIDAAPSVTYKMDTVEYRAADYKVRENASMEDLLKKMEGIEVDKDGNVTAQGVAITRARLNGRNVQGAQVATLIRELPAEIAEKVQVIDDYGDEAELTGVKTGDPEKVLNIVTRRDKSVRNTLTASSTTGQSGRIRGDLGGNRQNANQLIRVSSNFTRTLTGVAGSSGGGGGGFSGGSGFGGRGGGNPGVSKEGGASFSYGDDLSKKIQVSAGYNFSGNGNNSEGLSNSTNYQKTKGSDKIDTIYSDRSNLTSGSGHGHEFSGRLQYRINTGTQLIFTPSLRFNTSANSGSNLSNSTGGRIQNSNGTNSSHSSTPSYSLQSSFTHRFGTSRTNIGGQVSATNNGNEQLQNSYNHLLSYNPASIAHELLKDSLTNRLINTDNETKNYRASTTFRYGLSAASNLEFNAQISYRGYDNSRVVNDITNSGPPIQNDRLSKIFNYSFTETRYSLNYRRGNNATKVNYSLGITAIPGLLKGESQTLHNTTERRSFNIIPITRIEYRWNTRRTFSLNYSGNPQEPSFDQIQDVPDETNPNNVIIGNPDLKTAFSHNISATFNNYIQAQRINMQFSLNKSMTDNQVTTTRTATKNPLTGIDYRETRYINQNGNYSYRGNYSFGKSWPQNIYAIRLNGGVNNNHGISYNNGNKNFQDRWTFNERLTVQINPKEWIEMNPSLSHNFSKTNNTLEENRDSRIKNWAFSVEGRFIAMKSNVLGYEISKNYTSGLNANTTAKPLILDMYLSKEFLKRRGASVRLSVADLLNQNHYLDQRISETSTTITQTNTNSRYFTLGFQMRLNKFSGGGAGSRTAGPRRGDGSFIIP